MLICDETSSNAFKKKVNPFYMSKDLQTYFLNQLLTVRDTLHVAREMPQSIKSDQVFESYSHYFFFLLLLTSF